MKLRFNEAVALGNAWKSAKEAFDLLEDIRPAGGFKEAVEGDCKLCGAAVTPGNSQTTNDYATALQTLSGDLLSIKGSLHVCDYHAALTITNRAIERLNAVLNKTMESRHSA